MPIPNRELSQFGSFLLVDNTTRNIGIATTTRPFVGIGTTNPTSKLSVSGDLIVSGVITATAFSGQINSGSSGITTITGTTLNYTNGTITNLNGTNLNYGGIGTITDLNATNINATGIITALKYYGDGSTLTNVVAIATAPLFFTYPFTITSADSDTFNVRSGGEFNYSGFTVGRTGADGRISVAGNAGQFANNSLSGDIVIRTETTGSKLLFNNGSNNAALTVYNNNVLVNTITPNGSAPLQVSGNAYVSGNLGIGSPSPTSPLSVVGNASISGNVTALKYYGDGSALSNITSGVGINTAGGVVGTGATILDFRGSGISTVTVSSGIATINISGGNVSIAVTTVAPTGPSVGNLWYNTNLGRTFIYYSDGNSSQWVDAAPFNQGGLFVSKYGDNMYAGLGVTVGSVSSPSVYFNDYANTGFFAPGGNQFGITCNGSLILQASSTNVTVNGNARVSGVVTATTLDSTQLKNYTEVTSALGNTGTAATINLANGNVFTATLTNNCTFTFTTGVTSGTASFTLILTNDAVGGRSITWPVSVKWPNNSTPSRTTTANATDIWSFFTPNNGTTWYGNIALYNFT